MMQSHSFAPTHAQMAIAKALAHVAEEQRRDSQRHEPIKKRQGSADGNVALMRGSDVKDDDKGDAMTTLCVHPAYVVAQHNPASSRSPLLMRQSDATHTTLLDPRDNELRQVLVALMHKRSTVDVSKGTALHGGGGDGGGVALSIVACSSSNSSRSDAPMGAPLPTTHAAQCVRQAALSAAIGVVHDFIVLGHDEGGHPPELNKQLGSLPLRVAAALAYANSGLVLITQLVEPFVGCSLHVASQDDDVNARDAQVLIAIRVAYSPLISTPQRSPHSSAGATFKNTTTTGQLNPCLAQLLNMPLALVADLLLLGASPASSSAAVSHRPADSSQRQVEIATNVMRAMQDHYRPIMFPRSSHPSSALAWDAFVKQLATMGRNLRSAQQQQGRQSSSDYAAANHNLDDGTLALLRALLVMLLVEELVFDVNGSNGVGGAGLSRNSGQTLLLVPSTSLSADIMIVLAALVRSRPDVLSDTFLSEVLRLLTPQHEGTSPFAMPSASAACEELLAIFSGASLAESDHTQAQELLRHRDEDLMMLTDDEVLSRSAAVVLSRVLCTSPSSSSAHGFGGKRQQRIVTCALEGLTMLVTEALTETINTIMRDVMSTSGQAQGNRHNRTLSPQQRRRQRLSVVVTCCEALTPSQGSVEHQRHDNSKEMRGAFSLWPPAFHGEGRRHSSSAPSAAQVAVSGEGVADGAEPVAYLDASKLLPNIAADMATAFALRTLRENITTASTASFSLQLLQDSAGGAGANAAAPGVRGAKESSILVHLADLAAELHHQQHAPVEVGGAGSHRATPSMTPVRQQAAALLLERRMLASDDDVVVRSTEDKQAGRGGALELLVRLPHAWSSSHNSPPHGVAGIGHQHQPHPTYYNISRGLPLCPMPLTPSSLLDPTPSVQPLHAALPLDGGEHVLSATMSHRSTSLSNHSLLDALDPNMRTALMTKLAAGGDNNSRGGGGGRQQQPQHPALHRWQEQLLQCRVLHRRQLEACHQFAMHRTQSLLSPILRDDAVTHLYISGAGDTGEAAVAPPQPSPAVLASLSWCLGSYLLGPHDQSAVTASARGGGTSKYIMSIAAADFCEEFFPVVANAPSIAAMRDVRLTAARGRHHDNDEDAALLEAMCHALSFPDGSIVIDDLANGPTSSPDGVPSSLVVLLTAVGAQHLQSLRHSVDAIVQEQYRSEALTAQPAGNKGHHGDDEHRTEKESKNTKSTALHQQQQRHQQLGGQRRVKRPATHKDPLVLQFTPNKRFVDSGTVRYLSQSGDADDLLGFRYHESQAAIAAAAEEASRQAEMEAALRDRKQPSWRRVSLIPLEQQVHLTHRVQQRCKPQVLSASVIDHSVTQQHMHRQLPTSVPHREAVMRRDSSSNSPRRRQGVPARSSSPPPSARRHQQLPNTSAAARPTVVGHVAADVSFATISSIRSSSRQRPAQQTLLAAGPAVKANGGTRAQTAATTPPSRPAKGNVAGGASLGSFGIHDFLSMVRAAH